MQVARCRRSGFKLRDVGQTYEFTFDQAGEYPYYCVVHPAEMTGKVVVVAEGASPPPSVEPPPSETETGVPVANRVTAGVKNVFNKAYYDGAINANVVSPALPRNFSLGVTYFF